MIIFSSKREWALIITPELYHANRGYRDMADRIMTMYNLVPDQTTEIRMDEGAIEIDWFYMPAEGLIHFDSFHTTIVQLSPNA